MSGFQQTVNVFNTLGFVGDLAFDGPIRSLAASMNSSGTPNLIGNAFTYTSGGNPEPAANSSDGCIVQVGGTGVFAGILINSKEYALRGVTGNPLGATLALPDNSDGDFLFMGEVFVNLPGPAAVGDLITYDSATGNLNSVPPAASFTAAIAAGGSAGVLDLMTVSAITLGSLQVGQLVTGAGVAGGTYIASLGTGKGGTGTYHLTSVNSQTVSSEVMSATALPTPAFSGAGYITPGTSPTTDTLHITTATSGEIVVGQQVFGTGILPNTVVTGYSGGSVGGTGAYTLNTIGQTVASSGTPETITGPGNIFVPRAVVARYTPNSTGGVAAIRLTN